MAFLLALRRFVLGAELHELVAKLERPLRFSRAVDPQHSDIPPLPAGSDHERVADLLRLFRRLVLVAFADDNVKFGEYLGALFGFGDRANAEKYTEINLLTGCLREQSLEDGGVALRKKLRARVLFLVNDALSDDADNQQARLCSF